MASSAGTSSFANQKRLPGGSKKIVKKGSTHRDSGGDPSLDLTGLSSLVAKPAVRRKIYSEARSFLGDAKTETQELSSKVLFQQAAASVRHSVRKASIAGLAIDQMSQSLSGFAFRSGQAADELAESAAGCRLSASTSSEEQMPRTTTQGGMDADHIENEAEVDNGLDEVETESLRQHFLRTLEEVKQILERIDLSDTLEEVSHVLDWVKELEAMMDEMTSSCQENDEVVGARKDVEERVQHALEMTSKKIPEALQAIHRCRSPHTSQLASDVLMNMKGFQEQSELCAPSVKPTKSKGKGHKKQDQEQAKERRFSREQLRQKLRSDASWMPLPPTGSPKSPKTRGERSRESWLKWWSDEEGDAMDRRDAFFQNLPPNKLTLTEMELRDAIIDFLEQKKPEERSPTWDEIRVQPMVLECTKRALPHFVSLEEWLHRRQRLSNHGVVTWPPPPPLWRLEPIERWKKDLPEPLPEAPRQVRFQRRDSTQRRGSSVFGVNFQVTDHGQIFGVLAGDEEAVRELPWPCSSVVPEQKSFGWIKGSGTRGCLPSVATQRNMTVEDVMAWRLSHRFRQRQVEPVLQSMWQALAKQRLPKTCTCEHCSGTLQYEITLASSE